MSANQTWLRFLPPFLRSKLDGRYTLQKILSNTSWLLADRVLRMGVGLVVGVWVARYLGPEQFGLLNYAIAFVALFSVLANLGLDSIVIREVIHNPDSKDQILGTAFILKLISGVFAWLLTIGSAFLLRPDDGLFQQIVGIVAAGMLFQSLDTADFWFQAQCQSKYPVVVKSIAFMVITLTKIVLIQKHASLVAFAWAGLAEVAISSVGLIIAYRVNGHLPTKWQSSFAWGKQLIRDSFPLIFSGIMIIIYMRIDQIMIAETMGNKEIGLYSAAVRLAEVWYFIPTAIVSSTFPSIVEAKQISEELFYTRLQKLYQWIALFSYTIAIPVTFLAGWLVQLLFGSAYQKAGVILSVLIWSGLFVGLGVARSSFLTTTNQTKLHFLTVSLGCLTNIALNLVLIPRFGGLGAAIATCISYWFAAHGSCFVYKPLFKTGNMLTKAIFLMS